MHLPTTSCSRTPTYRCRSSATVVLLLLISSAAFAADWPYWRGPEYNGISRETGLIDDWDPAGGEGSNVLWQSKELGGISTPIVLGGKLYTIVRSEPRTPREGEKVVCVDAATGRLIWEHRFNVYLSDVPDTRVGWSSCVADVETGRIYALGVCGLFHCLDGETGEVIWSVPLHEKFGLLSTYGGRTNFPVICEDLVIISGVIIGWGDMAKPCHRFMAFDKSSGEMVWFQGTQLLPEDTTYSAPSLAVIAGQKALVFGSGDGAVWAFQPRTGKPIWEYRFSRRGLNVAPLVVGDLVYSSHSEENVFGTMMGSVVCIDGDGQGDITNSGEVWKVDEIMAGKSSPIAVNNQLFVFDDRAKLHVFDAETGDRIGDRINLGNMMRASPLFADGKIYSLTAGGQWHISRPDPDEGAKIVRKGRLPRGEECIASPICADGRIYVQTTGCLYCLADPSKTPGSVPPPEMPAEDDVTLDQTPAQLQVVPCELLLEPGASQTFTARLFNQKGQFLQNAAATFQVSGEGQISADGRFVADPQAKHTAATITATAAGISGQARVRIIPPLPWKFDFEDISLAPRTSLGEPPISWVGCRYRHVIRRVDGNNVMVKVTTIPKGTRSRAWFGQPELHDYTIQADVRGATDNGKMPDIGLIAQGYAIDLQGANQVLQIRSWVPQLRMASTIPFDWSPDTWYRMKFRVETRDDKALLFGKVWPLEDQEPTDWSITAEDTSPNLAGSPGLYGNAKDAEIFLDNIVVTEN